MELEHVNGENKGDILLFALSTCGWCKKTREHLEKLNLEYDYIYVDLTEGAERNEAVETLQKYNKDISFPTIVYNDKDIIIGYKPDEIDDLIKE